MRQCMTRHAARMAAGALVMLVLACRGEAPVAPTAVPHPSERAGARRTLSTEEQAVVDAWRADGSPAQGMATALIESSFGAGYTSFSATGQVLFNYYSNDNLANMKMDLLLEDGGSINSESVLIAGGANAAPLGLGQVWHSATHVLSTRNRHCGLLGKAKITGHSILKEWTPFGYAELWNTPIEKIAPERLMPDCPEQFECNGYIVEDPSTCDDESGGGPSGGGEGGGGGGSGPVCELWQFTLRRSYDGGLTWEVVNVWTEWIGTGC